MVFQVARVTIVIALVIYAAILVTPKGRTPLALRAIRKLFQKANGAGVADAGEPVSVTRRLIAFGLVILAFAIAVF